MFLQKSVHDNRKSSKYFPSYQSLHIQCDMCMIFYNHEILPIAVQIPKILGQTWSQFHSTKASIFHNNNLSDLTFSTKNIIVTIVLQHCWEETRMERNTKAEQSCPPSHTRFLIIQSITFLSAMGTKFTWSQNIILHSISRKTDIFCFLYAHI